VPSALRMNKPGSKCPRKCSLRTNWTGWAFGMKVLHQRQLKGGMLVSKGPNSGLLPRRSGEN
jgi:hypothetical protein